MGGLDSIPYGDLITGTDASTVITGLLCCFVLTQAIAAIYGLTYRGFSYSRTFVHALILGGLATCIVIDAIDDSLARGLGVLGALAIIRFRTQIRDARDIVFLFACLAVGIASGAGAYLPAVLGTAVFLTVALFLHLSPFASLHVHEGVLRFVASEGQVDEAEVLAVLQQCCHRVELASVRDALTGDGEELSYQIRLRDQTSRRMLIERLHHIPGIADPSLIMHRATVEL